jgi:outer membrane protein assembly factor BamB
VLWQTTHEASRFLTNHNGIAALGRDEMADLVLATISAGRDDQTLAQLALCAIDGRNGKVRWRTNATVEMPADARREEHDSASELHWSQSRVAASYLPARDTTPGELGVVLSIRYPTERSGDKVTRTFLHLDPTNGRLRLKHSTGAEDREFEFRLGRGRDARPIFFVHDGSDELSATNAADGSVLWRTKTHKNHFRSSTFEIADLNGDGGDEIVVCAVQSITVVDGETGERRWAAKEFSDFFECLQGNETARLATRSGIWDFSKGFDRAVLQSMKWNPAAVTWSAAGSETPARYYAFEEESRQVTCYADDGKLIRWRTTLRNTPAIQQVKLRNASGDGRLYLSFGDSYDTYKVYCLDAATSQALWESSWGTQRLIESRVSEIPPRTVGSHYSRFTIASVLATSIPTRPDGVDSDTARLRAAFPSARKIASNAHSTSPSPDASQFAIDNYDSIKIADAAGQTQIQSGGFRSGGFHSPQWSPTNDGILYAQGDFKGLKSTIWLYDLKTRQHRKLAEGNLPTWSKDGKSLFYVKREQGNWSGRTRGQAHVYSLDVTQSDAKPDSLLVVPAWDAIAAVSPDAMYIAYVEYRQDRGYLRIARSGQSAIEFERQYEYAGDIVPAWSPDSRRLVISQRFQRKNATPVWLIDVETKRMRTVWNGRVNNVSWWPDSKQLVIHARGEQPNEAWLIDPTQRRFAR